MLHFLVYCMFFAFANCDIKSTNFKHPVLIVISFDGFRFDYFNRVPTPNFDYIRNSGASLPYMRNQFVTKTFPNHMSISTGLHEEAHGVIENAAFDPLYNTTFNETNALFWNYNGNNMPLWTLNELAGDGRKSGSMMWPGAEIPYGTKNSTPSRIELWNSSIPLNSRVDTVIGWITDAQEPINLAFLYFEEPDEIAHAFGPESEQVKEIIVKLDSTVGYLTEQLMKKELFDKVNMILLSDHGFQEVKMKNIINISNIGDSNLYEKYGKSPVIMIQPHSEKFDQVYGDFKEASKTRNFTVYSKSEIAKVPGWFYSKNRRIMDIILVADLGYVFDDFFLNIEQYNKKFNRTPSDLNVYGTHGYDNNLIRMHPFFMAHGPLFKNTHQTNPIDNVDVFSLVCFVIGIDPPGNNGSFEHVKDLLLITRSFTFANPLVWALGAGLIFGAIILMGIVSIVASKRFGQTWSDSADYLDGYRFLNHRNSPYDSTDENENVDGILDNDEYFLYEEEKEESKALLFTET